jgi:hypothetical protein
MGLELALMGFVSSILQSPLVLLQPSGCWEAAGSLSPMEILSASMRVRRMALSWSMWVRLEALQALLLTDALEVDSKLVMDPKMKLPSVTVDRLTGLMMPEGARPEM